MRGSADSINDPACGIAGMLAYTILFRRSEEEFRALLQAERAAQLLGSG